MDPFNLTTMKYIVSILFFLCPILTISQTTYSIPNASIQPRFIFPIYFEEAGGHRDTLYLGYDSSSTGLSIGNNNYDDSAFGVKPIPIDTTSFYVLWGNELYKSFNPLRLKDSVYKTNVSPLTGSGSGAIFPFMDEIRMNNGVLPLKISWNKSLFYSDSLPFHSNPSTPRGQGRFGITFSNNEIETENGNIICQFWQYILVSDTTTLSICTAKDSMTISNLQGDSIPVDWGIFTFFIEAWSGINVGVEETDDHDLPYVIYPNPFRDNLTIVFNNERTFYSITITDLLGCLIYKAVNRIDATKVITEGLSKGVYIVELIIKNKIYKIKIIKQ